jgi:hypothetical protein
MSSDASTDRHPDESRDEGVEAEAGPGTSALDHLVDAAKDLIGAARSVLDAIEAVIDEQVGQRDSVTDTGESGWASARTGRDARVRRIDLD